jgi:hypothetical protein
VQVIWFCILLYVSLMDLDDDVVALSCYVILYLCIERFY